MAKDQKKLFHYIETTNVIGKIWRDRPQENPFPNNGYDDGYAKTLQEAYKAEVRKKEMEINQLKTSNLKDSIRISFFELGQIHTRFGFANEALKAFIKSHDYSVNSEDLFKCSMAISRSALELKNYSFVFKYSGEAEQRDFGKNKLNSAIIKTVDGLGHLIVGKQRQACMKLVEVVVEEDPELTNYATPKDLLSYVTIGALDAFTRKELRDKMLSNSKFKSFPEYCSIIQNFLDGHYAEFLKGLFMIEQNLKFDLYMAHQLPSVLRKIKKKAFVQYITPYKIIDLKEMAQNFNMSVQDVENEVADLIVDGDIQAKIDNHNKLLYARQDNEKMKSFQRAIKLGKHFIGETEGMLLRLKLIKEKNVLVPPKTNK